MSKIMIGSVRPGAGKTSLIVGLMAQQERRFGYIKPFGDRLIYKRKRNWDYDSNLILELFELDQEPEGITLGFDQSKLRYMFSSRSIEDTLTTMADAASEGKDLLFVEGGQDVTYGSSLELDTLSVARYTGARLFMILNGNNDEVMDDIAFIKNYLKTADVNFGGIIINKVRDVAEFNDIYRPMIEKYDLPIAGVVPLYEDLTFLTISYVAEKLHAKVIAGDTGLGNVIRNVLVGAMSTDETMRNPLFNSEDKFLITSGDRSDMILAAIDRNTRGIVLTNNILPPANIIAKARENNVPLLLVTMDTFQVAKQIDRMEALLTKDNEKRILKLRDIVSEHLNLDMIFAP
jgi:hypothetical protein